jgi:hypothetical protein
VLLLPDVVLEGACAFIIIVGTDNESKLSPITKNKSMNMTLLLLPLSIAFFVIEITIPLIICYICSVKNKQYKYFKVKIRTIFFAIKLVIVGIVILH